MSHSCRSNSKFIVYPSHKLAVLAQTAIDAGDEINVSRVPVLEPTWKRRAMLFRLESIYTCQSANHVISIYKTVSFEGSTFSSASAVDVETRQSSTRTCPRCDARSATTAPAPFSPRIPRPRIRCGAAKFTETLECPLSKSLDTWLP